MTDDCCGKSEGTCKCNGTTSLNGLDVSTNTVQESLQILKRHYTETKSLNTWEEAREIENALKQGLTVMRLENIVGRSHTYLRWILTARYKLIPEWWQVAIKEKWGGSEINKMARQPQLNQAYMYQDYLENMSDAARIRDKMKFLGVDSLGTTKIKEEN